MKQAKRFSQLTAPRQALVRLLQSVNFGYLECLEVRSGEPVFNPAPTAFVEVKLDTGNEPRPEVDLMDFELGNEVIRLMEQLDELGNGNIERIDVRYGDDAGGRASTRLRSLSAPADRASGQPSPNQLWICRR
jgi:hypothetical protein